MILLLYVDLYEGAVRQATPLFTFYVVRKLKVHLLYFTHNPIVRQMFSMVARPQR